MIRLFVALSLPEEVRLRLEGLRGGLPARAGRAQSRCT